MTKEEAKRNLRYALEWNGKADPESLKIAIEALEQQDAIEECTCCEYRVGGECCYADVEQIEDAISREVARRIIDSGRSIEQMLGILNNTPSVHPKPRTSRWIKQKLGYKCSECDLCVNEYGTRLYDYCPGCGARIVGGDMRMSDDAISREAVLETEYYVKVINDVEYVMLSEVQMKARKLPSVQPQQKPCGDCISRQAMIDVIERWLGCFDYNDAERHIMRATQSILYDLPPVNPQPKTGHWILADEQNKEDVENDNYRFICSECQYSDIHAKDTIVPYCWKCGTRMVEPKEGEG